jgi:hypothetical protein
LTNGDKIYPPFNKAEREKPSFQDLFLSQSPNILEKELFEVCFEEESAAISVNDGMFGRPAIGATILPTARIPN